MEIWELVLSSILSAFSGAFGTALMVIFLKRRGTINSIIYDSLFDIAENKELQEVLYTIGQIAGFGLKNGLGWTGKSGKGGIKEMIMTYLGQKILPKLMGDQGESEKPGSSENPLAS